MKPEVGSLWKCVNLILYVRVLDSSFYVKLEVLNNTTSQVQRFALPEDDFVKDFIPLTKLEKELL